MTLFQTQLSTRRQKEGEDLGVLVQNIRRLMSLAFPGPTTVHSESIAVRSFIDAIRDREVAMKVRENEPSCLDKAYNLAMRYEGYRKAEKNGFDSYERRPARVKTVKEPDSNLETIQKMIDDALARQKPFGAKPRYWRNMKPSPAMDSSTDDCEHMRTEPSTNRAQPYPRENRSNDWRAAKTCYECGQPGHLERHCPNRFATAPPEETTESHPTVTKLHHIVGSSNAYLALRINGRNVWGLVDTGCELSLAPASLVKKGDLVKSRQLLRAANGTEIRVVGETLLSCETEGYTFGARCLVSAQISELILGLAWLEEQRAQWHFGEPWITINGHVLPIHSRSEPVNCRKIAIARDVRVPPMSEMNIEAFAVLPSLSIECGTWATQPQQLDSGLWVAGTLLPDRLNDLVVGIMNPTGQTVKLRRGLQCATEEVEVMEEKHLKSNPGECNAVCETNEPLDEKMVEQTLAPLWNEVAEDVPESIKEDLRRLILKNQSAFSLHEFDLGYTEILQHEIDTGEEKPVRQSLRRQLMSLLPLVDEQIERFHITLNCMLDKFVSQNQRDWDLHFPYVPAAYRASENESTGYTPNRLFLSRELCLPIDLILGDCRVLPDRLSTDAFVVDQLERMQIDFQCVREFMQRQASTRAFRYDLCVKETSFQPGDLVWYFYPRRRSGLKDKLNKNYTGQYQVLDKLSPVLYRIRKSSKSPPLIVYVDKLKLVEGDFSPMEACPRVHRI